MLNRRKKINSRAKKLIWLGLGVLAVCLRYLLGIRPQVAEKLYFQGFFPVVRWGFDFTMGFLPVPFVYVLAAMIVGFLIFKIVHRRKSKPDSSPALKQKAVNLVLNFGAWLGGLVFFFFVLWGFNYARVPIEDHAGLKLQALDPVSLKIEARQAAIMAIQARAFIPGAGDMALESDSFPSDLEPLMRKSLVEVLNNLGYPAPGRIRARILPPIGIMMRFQSAGIYFPFTGEAIVDGSLTPIEVPFSMAHEMAHGFGFTDEGTANFLAWLACENSSDPSIRYSGRIIYWSYVSRELSKTSPGEFKSLWAILPQGMKSDLRAVNDNWDRYRGRLMNLGRKVNDTYLKAQGIREGIENYDRMVILVSAWHRWRR